MDTLSTSEKWRPTIFTEPKPLQSGQLCIDARKSIKTLMQRVAPTTGRGTMPAAPNR
jgi:hypothetical protein